MIHLINLLPNKDDYVNFQTEPLGFDCKPLIEEFSAIGPIRESRLQQAQFVHSYYSQVSGP